MDDSSEIGAIPGTGPGGSLSSRQPSLVLPRDGGMCARPISVAQAWRRTRTTRASARRSLTTSSPASSARCAGSCVRVCVVSMPCRRCARCSDTCSWRVRRRFDAERHTLGTPAGGGGGGATRARGPQQGCETGVRGASGRADAPRGASKAIHPHCGLAGGACHVLGGDCDRRRDAACGIRAAVGGAAEGRVGRPRCASRLLRCCWRRGVSQLRRLLGGSCGAVCARGA